MIKFEDVKVGDRVKLVNENGDTAEVTVSGCNEYAVWTEFNTFRDTDCWSVAEILEKPMPNKPGTILRWEDGNIKDDRYVKLSKPGWVSLVTGEKFTDGGIKACYNPKKVVTEYEPE